MKGLGILGVAIAALLTVMGLTRAGELPRSPTLVSPSVESEKEWEDIDHSNFDDGSVNIDNEWLPMPPGLRLVHEGVTMEDDEPVPHRVVFTVTDLTKVIDGIRSVVLLELDYSDGELAEAELAFFAQDKDGTVWHLGQYPEEYEDGEFVAAPAWIAGFEEARAGIAMKSEPKLDTGSYSQGWGPAVDWTDRAKVHAMGEKACVPADCYEDVLVTDETARSEPDAHQYKYYARGVGTIRVGWSGADTTQEVLELVEVVRLDAKALAEVREAALKLEEHAYEVSTNVYAKTPRLEHRGASEQP